MSKALRRRILRLGLVALLLGLIASWAVGSLLSRSTNAPVAAAFAPARDVSFTAEDGIKIAATYRPGPTKDAPALLLLHGNGASRAAVDANAAWFSDYGYATLAIDFRGHGESTAADHSFGLFEARDARAAFNWLKNRQSGAKIGVIGISLGGAATLLGEEGPLPADAVVLQAVYPDIRAAIRNRLAAALWQWVATVGEPFLSYQSRIRQGVWPDRLSPLKAATQIKVPVLVIGGAEDRFTPIEESELLCKAVGKACQLWIVPGEDHAALSSEESDAYRERLSAFFDGHLKTR